MQPYLQHDDLPQLKKGGSFDQGKISGGGKEALESNLFWLKARDGSSRKGVGDPGSAHRLSFGSTRRQNEQAKSKGGYDV
jgi:hypothetical protein